MQLSEFTDSGRAPSLPLSLNCEGGELTLLSWLRVLPGKRYVAEAVWRRQGRQQKVLVKLYLGARAAAKMQAERRGCDHLHGAGLSTPEVVVSGADGRRAWLLLEWLEGAETLAKQLNLAVDSCAPTTVDLPQALYGAIDLLQRMHGKKILQRDLHADNFIFSNGSCYVIDAADLIEGASADDLAANLGVFLAQFPHLWWAGILSAYLSKSSQLESETVILLARKHRLWRARDLQAKSQRDCTLFQYRRDFHRWTSVWRDRADDLAPLLDNIESVVAGAKMLKDGGSSTVVLADWQGRPVVIKRYNIKSFAHFLRRCLRPSRASHSWRQGHLWRVLEMPTARPLAVIEKRWGPLRLGGYLITEFTPGEDIIDAFAGDSEVALAAQLDNLESLLQRMADYRLSHGDLKGTNVLAAAEGLSFIDLDAARCHSSKSQWQHAFLRDLTRLGRNWPTASAAYQGVASAVARLKRRL